jgi:hypothetical protein
MLFFAYNVSIFSPCVQIVILHSMQFVSCSRTQNMVRNTGRTQTFFTSQMRLIVVRGAQVCKMDAMCGRWEGPIVTKNGLPHHGILGAPRHLPSLRLPGHSYPPIKTKTVAGYQSFVMYTQVLFRCTLKFYLDVHSSITKAKQMQPHSL